MKHKPESKPVVDFIQQFRSTISPDITASGRYSFKAFLIQVANHKSENALPIQFVHYDKLSEDERKKVANLVAMVKFKEVPVSNLNVMKAGEVAKRVQQALGNPKIQRGKKQVDRFNVSVHRPAGKNIKFARQAGVPNPENPIIDIASTTRCTTITATLGSVADFLVEKLQDEKEFDSLYKVVPPAAGRRPSR